MSSSINKNAIQEARDQLSLDFADGKYLNIVTANLGLTRPRIGLTDDVWRACAKVIALNYKQTRQAIEQVLAIILGPKETAGTALVQDATIGDTSIYVENTEGFPQVGTLILDERLINEESVQYCYIDRTTGEIQLVTPLQYDHTAILTGADFGLINTDTNSSDAVSVENSALFPNLTPFLNYAITIGAGTDEEEANVVYSLDNLSRLLYLAFPLVNIHTKAKPAPIKTSLASDYHNSSLLLHLANVSKLPTTGTLVLSASGPTGVVPPNDHFTATGGTTSTITLAASTLTTKVHGGNKLVFDPNTTTAALRDLVVPILSNTDALITLANLLPASVVSGDTFKIKPVISYWNVDYNTNMISLNHIIPDLEVKEEVLVTATDTVDTSPAPTSAVIEIVTGGLTANAFRGFLIRVGSQTSIITSHTASSITVSPAFPSVPTPGETVSIYRGTAVELLEYQERVFVSQVKVNGVGWDVVQTTSNHFDILLPNDLNTIGDLRASSYLHTTYDSTTPTITLASNIIFGDTSFVVNNPHDFPIVGVAVIDPGILEERVAYYNNRNVLVAAAAATDTTITVEDSSGFVIGETIVIGPNTAGEETVTISNIDLDTNVITISALSNAHAFSEAVVSTIYNIPSEVTVAAEHVAGVTIALYQPDHPQVPGPISFGTPNTHLLNGNLHTIDDVFPGPYLYTGLGSQSNLIDIKAPGMGQGQTSLDQLLPGPTYLMLSQVVSRTTLEVNFATAFELQTFPYNAQLGLETGNFEIVNITGVSLKQRTATTIDNGGPLSATNVVPVTAVLNTSGAGIPADSFPVGTTVGFRIILSRGLPEEEVAYVISSSSVDDEFTLDRNLQNTHANGASVELLSDVLTVNPLDDSHEGITTFPDRYTRWPIISKETIQFGEVLVPEITEITPSSITGFATNGNNFYLNFSGVSNSFDTTLAVAIPVASTSIQVVVTSGWPLTPFVVVMDRGSKNEEVVIVSSRIGTTLNLASPLRFSHLTGSKVSFNVVGDFLIGNIIRSTSEYLTYDTISGITLEFSSPIVLQSMHSPGESLIVSSLDSEPNDNGYDFPLILPSSVNSQVQTLIDLIRAAGVDYTFTSP